MKKGFNIVATFILLPYIFWALVLLFLGIGDGDGDVLVILDILLGTGTWIVILLFLYNQYKKSRIYTNIDVDSDINKDVNKIVRIDNVENNTNDNIYEIVYINIENGKKKKEVVVEGHRLFNKLNNKLLTEGDNFYE